jgi:hypothetical protein
MGELNTVTISLDRFEKLLLDSYELKQVNADITNIRAMVFEEIADDCRKYGKAYADGKSTANMCRHLFHKIGISNPSAHPAIQGAIKEYEEKKAREES